MPICLALICPNEDFEDFSFGQPSLFEVQTGFVDLFMRLGKLISWMDISKSTLKRCLFKEPKLTGLDMSI